MTLYGLRDLVPLWASFVFLLVGCAEPQTKSDAAVDSVAVQSPLSYVGSKVCGECHKSEFEQWQKSHHQLAMQPATPQSVLGDFEGVQHEYNGILTTFGHSPEGFTVRTDGVDGALENYTVRYTFGVAPLQQYLLEPVPGRLQALSIAWDSRVQEQGGQRWMHLYPDEQVDHNDVLHWTKSSANWNYMCADCHSTGLRKNYDANARTYSSDFAEVSVGCEACHGEGSGHVTWAQQGSGDSQVLPLRHQQQQINACAQCHSRRSQLRDGFTPQKNFFDYYQPALLESGLYHPDGQILDEVYVYGSFLQSKMHAKGVQCSNCHDPHSAELRLNGNAVCTQCHSPAGRAEFPTLAKANYDTPAHYFHTPGTSGAACVSCHMPAKTYMQVDDRHDHSFRIPRPDLTATLGVPNACSNCHRDRDATWAAAEIVERFGPLRAQHFGPIFAAAQRGADSAEAGLVAIANDPTNAPIVRATALSLLVSYEQFASTRAIEQALGDQHPLVRMGALVGAGRWPATNLWQRARMLLNDEVTAVRVEAIRQFVNVAGSLEPVQQQALQPHLLWYLEMLKFNADVASGQTNIAGVHLVLGDIEAAQTALQTALQLNPQWVPALVNLADLYRATGRDALAGPLLLDALGLVPENPQVVLGRALWLVRNGATKDALPLLGRAVALAPFDPQYAYIYAAALHATGNSAGALDVLDETLARGKSRRLLEAAMGIAREAGLVERMNRYELALRNL